MQHPLRQYWHSLTLGALVGGLVGYFLGAHFEKRVQLGIQEVQKKGHKQDLAYVEEKAEDYRHKLFDLEARVPDLVDEKARELWESLTPQQRLNASSLPISKLQTGDWEQAVLTQPISEDKKQKTVEMIRDLNAYKTSLSATEIAVVDEWKSQIASKVIESVEARATEIPEPYRENFLEAIRSPDGAESIGLIAEKKALQIMQQQDLQILTEKAASDQTP